MNTKAVIFAALGFLFASSMAGAADRTSTLDGTWKNTDAKTRGVVKITITVAGEKASIQAWGSCQPTPCDWGKTTMNLLGESVDATELANGLAKWDTDFADTYMTLRREGDELVVATYTIFKDDSKRSNYRSSERFKLSKD